MHGVVGIFAESGCDGYMSFLLTSDILIMIPQARLAAVVSEKIILITEVKHLSCTTLR